MIKHVFLDLDDTILDFHKAEEVALEKTLRHFSIPITEENKALYSRINKGCWEALERGEITRAELRLLRFARFFEQIGAANAELAPAVYENFLSQGHYFLPGAEEAVKALQKKYRLFLVSNGTASAQHRRLTSAGLYPYFERVFISQEIGYNKPALEFFDRCFAQIPDFDPQKAIIVGDSLSSDIQGGINAGILTCWVNPKHKTAPDSRKPNFEIENITQLEPLLEQLTA